tara:strand:- start:173 stop:343 length:171 start_codon:yes stop_codon:yes gene_type:complete
MTKITARVEQLMTEGTASKIKGWTMKNIVEIVSQEMGTQAGTKAREYILEKCGYKS